MAANEVRWVRNELGAPGPFKFKGKFQAGATAAIKRGEILELASGNFIPLDADQSMAGILAVSDCELRTGDLAGYHDLIVPRPGDVFEIELAAAAANAQAAPLYWVNSQKLTVTPGTNIVGTIVDDTIFPAQGFQSVNPSFDAGTTARTTNKVRFAFRAAASYWVALFT
jgi:hypothetical protein